MAIDASLKPVYALADSRLLFWRKQNRSQFLEEIVRGIGKTNPCVAYVGASNYDRPEYYRDIFEAAMADIRYCECRMVLSEARREDQQFLSNADMIVLAGGSVEAGWRVFSQNGYRELIMTRFQEGATLLGVSAGAVQLGKGGLTDDGSAVLYTFGLLPFYVGAHEENEDWRSLRKTLRMSESGEAGIGIPSGGGVIWHDEKLEPIAKPIHRIAVED